MNLVWFGFSFSRQGSLCDHAYPDTASVDQACVRSPPAFASQELGLMIFVSTVWLRNLLCNIYYSSGLQFPSENREYKQLVKNAKLGSAE